MKCTDTRCSNRVQKLERVTVRIDEMDPMGVIDFDEWQGMVDLLCKLANVTSAAITRLDPPYIEAFKVSKSEGNPFYEGMKVELATHYCEEVVRRRDRVLVRDARNSERWGDAPELRHSLVSYMGYPILLPDGDVFGTICVHDKQPNAYSEEIDQLIRSFRNIVESHFALAKQADELKKKIDEIQQLKGIIPICSHCKSIRNDKGYWLEIEAFVQKHPHADFSHGICPECAKRHYPDLELYDE